MNILFFLSPKQDLMYVYDDFTLRQTLEKWENNRYASIPVLNRQGKYVGTLTEGDILWGLKKFHGLDLEAAEDASYPAESSSGFRLPGRLRRIQSFSCVTSLPERWIIIRVNPF